MKIKTEVFVYDLSNPPLPDRTVDAEIIICNKNRLELSNWARVGQISQYTMTITEPKSLGLKNTIQNTIDTFYADLILSFNLQMNHGTMLFHNPIMAQNEIDKEKSNAEQIKMEKIGSLTKITVNETLEVTDSVKFGISFKEELPEKDVIEILLKIQDLNNVKNNNFDVEELKKSFVAYRSACSSFDRLTIFKNLYNSLELAVNSEGSDVSGSKLDEKINSLTNDSLTTIEGWRNFYSRTKHVNITKRHRQIYSEGIKSVPSWINPLRSACKKIMLQRLNLI